MDSRNELSTAYDAAGVEERWYQAWEDAGLFKPTGEGEPFTITIPPPNITGSLHMGHALCYPIQDALGRYKRLTGHQVLILPGQDHAGIATQSVVLKLMRQEGASVAEVGREGFLERAWKWREESGSTILNQFRRLGCGFDWSRERFTLDEGYVQAVLKVFIDWYDRGIIYRGKRVVNWDPKLETSVSDIETERKEIAGKLYHIRYPFADGSGHLIIATTRPETMLGDVAVAVNPSDERYFGLIGKKLILPLMGREIPLVADEYPDPAFGTGAVKVTPAHDPNDYEIGVRHQLPMPVIMDSKGRINANGGPYAGLDRTEARKRVVADLEEQGLLEKIEDYTIPIILSERSGEPIEPLLSEQWFARMSDVAGPAIAAVKDGRIRFHPERYTEIYLEWMENIRDWNISRQLWWGHRVPVYYDAEGNPYAAMSWSEAEQKAGRPIVRQDDDVLDTWFSSGLWPFATLGWPEQTEDLQRFYPTNVLVTSREILYLWVARMVMMGMDFAGEIPFRDVFIYATVLNREGKRMSKSLGTGVDPGIVIEKMGADALRYTLLSQTGDNQSIRYQDERTEEARNFCNKIWNATRFVLMNVPEPPSKPDHLEEEDRWLLSRLVRTEALVREAYERFDLQEACSMLYRFFWSELCDWYIEIAKGRLTRAESAAAPRYVLITALDTFLKMLHPIMPYLTEELYQHLPISNRSPFLMGSGWPQLDADFLQPEAERRLERIFAITRGLRALRAEVGLTPRKQVDLVYVEGDLEGGESVLRSQGWVAELRTGKPDPDVLVISMTLEGVDLHLPVEGLIDLGRETQRLAKEIEKLETDLGKLTARLANPQFRERANPEVVAKEEATAADLEEKLAKTKERLRLFTR